MPSQKAQFLQKLKQKLGFFAATTAKKDFWDC